MHEVLDEKGDVVEICPGNLVAKGRPYQEERKVEAIVNGQRVFMNQIIFVEETQCGLVPGHQPKRIVSMM